MVNSENPISAARRCENNGGDMNCHAPQPALRTRARISLGGRQKASPHSDAGKTQGQPSSTGWASMSSTALCRSAEAVAPLLVSSKRMQPVRPSMDARRSARDSMRRKPVNNSRRVAARAVAFPPASASRIVWPSFALFPWSSRSSLVCDPVAFSRRARVLLDQFEGFSGIFEDGYHHSQCRGGHAAPPVATPPRPSVLRGFAVLPARMSAFIRSMSAVCQAAHRKTTDERLYVRLDPASVHRQVDAFMRPLVSATYKSHNSETVIAPRTAWRSAEGSLPLAAALRASLARDAPRLALAYLPCRSRGGAYALPCCGTAPDTRRRRSALFEVRNP